MPVSILMPALSSEMEKGNLAKWLIREGDFVRAGDVICEVETDKAVMEIEAVDNGMIQKILVPEGTADIPVNQVLAVLISKEELLAGGATRSTSIEMTIPTKVGRKKPPTRRVFVSHVSEDRPVAMRVVSELEKCGVRCWIAPRDVRPGRPFDDEIVQAIEDSNAVLLIFSERCNENDYVRREITVAGEANKLVIPYRIDGSQPRKGLRVRLADLHWVDADQMKDEAVQVVLGALKNNPKSRSR